MGIKKQNGGLKGVGLTDTQVTEALGDMVARHVVQLSEHMSSVQIVCTTVGPNGTTQRLSYGSGDLYARTKACQCWLHDMHTMIDL